MLIGLFRHLMGRRPPGAMAGTFLKLVGVFGAWAIVLGVLFPVLGLSIVDPDDGGARFLIGLTQTAIAIVSVWFAIGLVGALFQRFGPAGGRDGLVIMLVICAVAGFWSIRGALLLNAGAPAQVALAWTPQVRWGEAVVRGDTLVVRGAVSLSMVDSMREALRAAPQVTALSIYSGGGSAGAVAPAVSLIRSRDLDVVVDTYCASACIPMFLAGRERVLAPRATLGCHQAADALTGRSVGPSRNFRDHPPAPGSQAVRQRIIRECDRARPEEIFVPKLADLVAIGAVTRVGASVAASQDAAEFCQREARVCAREIGLVR